MKKLFNHEELLQHLPNFRHDPLVDSGHSGKGLAIVLAHFGTTDREARRLAYEPMFAEVKARYPEVEIREAYTSRIIMKRLRDRGEIFLSLPETLDGLSKDGYSHVLIQPSVLIDGVEMESIWRDVQKFVTLFEEVRLSTPLLFHPLDYSALAQTMADNFDGEIVYVGHGTYDSSTAQYPMLQEVLRRQGKERILVSTIEGYPDLEDLIKDLRQRKSQKVLLRPLMYVAGVHAKEDISEEWFERLTKEGFDVSIELVGLGELESVREIYLHKLDFALNYRAWDIMEKKKIYMTSGEKM